MYCDGTNESLRRAQIIWQLAKVKFIFFQGSQGIWVWQRTINWCTSLMMMYQNYSLSRLFFYAKYVLLSTYKVVFSSKYKMFWKLGKWPSCLSVYCGHYQGHRCWGQRRSYSYTDSVLVSWQQLWTCRVWRSGWGWQW